jgi:LPS O-antigen subunit length determinant protein (WzzB/FepE family)
MKLEKLKFDDSTFVLAMGAIMWVVALLIILINPEVWTEAAALIPPKPNR